MSPNNCRNCGVSVPEGRTVCSFHCRAMLGGKAAKARTVAGDPCPYCASGSMRLVDGKHIAKDGRRYLCGAPRGGKPRDVDLVEEDSLDVHSALEAAVRRESAPPWVRHPQPWDNVVGRRTDAGGCR